MSHTLEAAVAAGLVFISAGAAQAQQPDPSLAPHYGDIALSSGFSPDPAVTDIRIGGDVSVSSAMSGRNGGSAGDGRCRGYVTAAPDLVLDYGAGSVFDLYIRAVSDVDNTLLVRDPGGVWHCDDDSGAGLNAQLHFQSPATGRYTIWAGAFGSGGVYEPGRIEISELSSGGPAWDDDWDDLDWGDIWDDGGSDGLDWSAAPIYGSVALRGGFAPDPHVVELAIGGSVDVAAALSGERIGNAGDGRCRGHAAAAPDYRLNFTPGSLPLIIRAISEADNTLVVNAPDGSWHCDDDSGSGVNAQIRFDSPRSGQYDIWVGAYSSGRSYEDGRLEISELGARRK
jgi:hypothetical protein